MSERTSTPTRSAPAEASSVDDRTAAIVVFGSKVLRDGTPSGSLLRRTLGARHFARTNSLDPVFIVSGGIGDHPPAEAVVMQKILIDAGVPGSRIMIDTAATDTVETVVKAADLIRLHGFRPVYVCSDDYHVPRCWLVTRILAGHCRPVWVTGSLQAIGVLKWAWYCCREILATPVDTLLALRWKLSRRT